MMISKHETDKLWMRYFNQTLYEKGLISEAMRNKMLNYVNGRPI